MCVKLDKQRFDAIKKGDINLDKYKLVHKNVPIVYKLFSRFQQNIAKRYSFNPGYEMLTTVKYAESNKLPFELIDMNA